jgi:glycosyltransferase involved in cell wall biosynthesis
MPTMSETAIPSRTRLQSIPDRIAVVYLARKAEGIAPLQRFVDSYAQNPAGVEHEVAVVYKGFTEFDDLNAAKSVFASLPHIGIEISDDGFDINAYLEAARRLEHDYICCVNTFTELASAGWLSILYQNAVLPRVGIVGAMGSYESLYDSYALIHKITWLCNEIQVSHDEQLAYYFDFIIGRHCRAWKARGEGRAIADLRLFASRIKARLSRLRKTPFLIELLRPGRRQGSLDEQFQRIWASIAGPCGGMADCSRFPPFPNPHIRSNGFMISRQRLLGVESGRLRTKFDACAFESGIDSLTSQIRRKGLRAVVVGRSGQGYDVADWPRSGTFRLGNQENLILTDNQSRDFMEMAPGTRATHVRITWGDSVGPPPPKFPDLGFKFAVDPLTLAEPCPKRRKFSFLIPSKNRLELLKFAVDSILRQNYRDFEIIISDNASKQDYAAFVNEIGDERIIYRRASKPVSVTENWNRALEMASGDYILMLGDDDALVPWFLPRVSELISTTPQPDIIYFASYHYCYPNVMPDTRKGYLADVRNSVFFKDREGPFLLPLEQAQSVAKAACDFRYLFGFNSQHFLFRAGFLKDICAAGGIFQSPYPDTFAAIVSFLKAQSVLVIPDPMVIIGISPKSFGYFYFNDRQSEGYEFLGNTEVPTEVRDSLKDVLLPGDGNNTNWLIAVEVARRALAPDFALAVNYERYRVLQMVAFLRGVYLKDVRQRSEIEPFMSILTQSERAVFSALRAAVEAAELGGRNFIIRVFESVDRQLEQFWPAHVTMIDIGDHSNISDAIIWLARERQENDVEAKS